MTFARHAAFAGAVVLLSIGPVDAARAAVMRMTLTGSVSATDGFDGADFFAPVRTGARSRPSVVYDTGRGYRWSDWQTDAAPAAEAPPGTTAGAMQLAREDRFGYVARIGPALLVR